MTEAAIPSPLARLTAVPRPSFEDGGGAAPRGATAARSG